MKISIKFNLDNDAFQDDGELCLESVAIQLRQIAEEVQWGTIDGIVRDLNGNTVGKWSIS